MKISFLCNYKNEINSRQMFVYLCTVLILLGAERNLLYKLTSACTQCPTLVFVLHMNAPVCVCQVEWEY